MPVLSRAVTGILLKLLSTMAFTCMSTLVRVAGKDVPVGEVVFCRSLFALVPLFAMLALRRSIRALGLRLADRRHSSLKNCRCLGKNRDCAMQKAAGP